MEERLPYGQLSLFTICNVADGISISVRTRQAMYPYASSMVMDFGLTEERSSTGYYAGFLCGGVMIGRAIGSPFWGWVADTYGRKPVLIISLLSIVIGSLVLGTAANFYVAIGSLFVSGLFCAISVVCKTCVSEVTPKSLQAKAMACYALGWYYGQIAGYSVGGLLVHPEDSELVSSGILVDFPYLLPNLVCVFFAVVALVGVLFFFRETLQKKSTALNTDTLKDPSPPSSIFSFLRSREVLIVFVLYSMQVFCSTGFVQTYPLWCWSSKTHGGLEFDPQEIGGTLSLAYTVMICVQSCMYNRMIKRLGFLGVIRCSSLVLIPLLLLFPNVGFLQSNELLLKGGLICCSLLYYLFGFNIFTSVFVLTNNSVSQCDRAKANGCSMAFGYIVKGVGPLAVGYTFAFTSQHGRIFPLDYRFVFVVLACGMMLEAVLAKSLPLTLESPKVEKTAEPESIELTSRSLSKVH